MSYLTYSNQGATRSLPLDPQLVSALSFLEEMGLRADVYSGGQPRIGTSDRRTGSTRHDEGRAADIHLYRGDERLSHANPEHIPILSEVVRSAREAGLTGIGMGPGYMGDYGMHVGYGPEAVWGAGGRSANAPAWLREAFYGADSTINAPGHLGPRSRGSEGVGIGPTVARAEAGLPLNTRTPEGAGLDEEEDKGSDYADDLIDVGLRLINTGYF